MMYIINLSAFVQVAIKSIWSTECRGVCVMVMV